MTKPIVWKVDEKNEVRLRVSVFSFGTVWINDQEIEKKAVPGFKNTVQILLDDGRSGHIKKTSVLGQGYEFEFKLEGELMLPEYEGLKRYCVGCSVEAASNDQFCQNCGKELPSKEDEIRKRNIKGTQGFLLALAVYFAVSGIAIFFLQKYQADKAIEQLASYDSNQQIQIATGETITVGKLRETFVEDRIRTAVANLILTTLMLLISFWGRRAPLPAMVTALGLYLVIQVANSIIYPGSFSQGLVMKIMITGFLIKGIKSAVELKKPNVT